MAIVPEADFRFSAVSAIFETSAPSARAGSSMVYVSTGSTGGAWRRGAATGAGAIEVSGFIVTGADVVAIVAAGTEAACRAGCCMMFEGEGEEAAVNASRFDGGGASKLVASAAASLAGLSRDAEVVATLLGWAVGPPT
jgi:hypothetical protein